MKWLAIVLFLLLPAAARAQGEPYTRPIGKSVTINNVEGIFFTLDEFKVWTNVYVDYRKFYDQRALTDKYELKLQKIEDLYSENLASCERRFNEEKNSVSYWQARSDAEKDEKFKVLKSTKLETALYQGSLGVETAAYIATVLGLILR